MIFTISKDDILAQLIRQLESFFMLHRDEKELLGRLMDDVMGRAQYGEGFSFLQGCTVGGYTPISKIPVYPTIGENVAMYANSTIIGNCTIGNNVNIGAGALVKNEDIPSDTNVFGQSPNLIIKSRKNV